MLRVGNSTFCFYKQIRHITVIVVIAITVAGIYHIVICSTKSISAARGGGSGNKISWVRTWQQIYSRDEFPGALLKAVYLLKFEWEN